MYAWEMLPQSAADYGRLARVAGMELAEALTRVSDTREGREECEREWRRADFELASDGETLKTL